MKIEKSKTTVDVATGTLSGDCVASSEKKLSQVAHLFRDRDALSLMDPDTVVYAVECHEAVREGTPGGLFFGTSIVKPGRVGDEYFMTKGHFHAIRETAEYYWGLSGTGVLLLMNENGSCRAEEVTAGSLHYIPGHVAHRLINTGAVELRVGACWRSDSGHDYGSIETRGFPVRVVCRDGCPVIEEEKQ